MGCGPSKETERVVASQSKEVPEDYEKAIARRRLSVVVQGSNGNLTADESPSNYFGNSVVATLGETNKGKVLFNAYSNTGYDPLDETYTRHNQDSYMVVEKFGDDENNYYFGVFDGHGEFGHYVSQTLAEDLPIWLTQRRIFGNVDPVSEIQACFEEFDRKIDKLVKKRFIASSVVASGATCNNAFLRGNELFVANVGDSRAVLGRREDDGTYTTVEMSVDHKPGEPAEKARIEAAGGLVCTDEDDEELITGLSQLTTLSLQGILRVWLPTRHSGMMVPGLAMSRSFGDYIVKSVGVIPKPEVVKRVLEEKDEFMVMASDGIWDVMSSEDVVDFVSKALARGEENPMRALVNRAAYLWETTLEDSMVDDTTAVMVFFGGAKKSIASGLTEAAQVAHNASLERLSDKDGKFREKDTVTGAKANRRRRLSLVQVASKENVEEIDS